MFSEIQFARAPFVVWVMTCQDTIKSYDIGHMHLFKYGCLLYKVTYIVSSNMYVHVEANIDVHT